MGSATLGTGYSFTLTRFPKWRNPSPIPGSFVPYQQNKRNFLFKSLKCVRISHPSLAAVKLRSLASEFTELTEPIDRVKRLLQYATLLPPFDESARVPTNRVTGCTAEVWLDVSLDEFGRTRFAVDSDSEITKGFCSCLIWILDGAEPEEVLEMKAEDLMEMNVGVGLGVRAHSRVNAWHSILTSMQKRTEALVADQGGKAEPRMEIFSSLVVSADNPSPKPQTQEVEILLLLASYRILMMANLRADWWTENVKNTTVKTKGLLRSCIKNGLYFFECRADCRLFYRVLSGYDHHDR